MFPFGKTIALTPNWFPPLPSAHGPARPSRRPLARRWPSMISMFTALIVDTTSLGAGQPWPQAAGVLPEGGPISALPQDLHVLNPVGNNMTTLLDRSVPLGGGGGRYDGEGEPNMAYGR